MKGLIDRLNNIIINLNNSHAKELPTSIGLGTYL